MNKKVSFSMKMPHNSYVGGIASIINSYMTGSDLFAKNGYDIELFNYQNSAVEKIKVSILKNIAYGIMQICAARKYVKSSNIDIFHIHTSRNSLFLKDLVLLKAVKKAGVKHALLTIHVGKAETVFEKIPKWMQKTCIKTMESYADKILFLTKGIQNEFIACGLKSERTSVLYNFYDIKPGNAELSESKDENLHLLFMGMINRDKGILELLTALQMVDDIPFVLNLCGTLTDESIRQEFEQKCQELGHKVNLRGYICGLEKDTVFAETDIFILPSYHEGMPLVILEALAGGCGIVATPVGATVEILDENNVSWVTVGSADDIAQRIRELYFNKTLLNKMKEKNLQASVQYTKEAHISKLCEIYRRIWN